MIRSVQNMIAARGESDRLAAENEALRIEIAKLTADLEWLRSGGHAAEAHLSGIRQLEGDIGDAIGSEDATQGDW